jgi:transposase
VQKIEAVMRLLRGEDVDKISPDPGVTAATLTRWREEFIAGGRTKLKSRPVVEGQDETLLRLSSSHIGGANPVSADGG